MSAPAPARTSHFLDELDGASPVAYIGPNWFASVMGTGIVSVALVGLPVAVPGEHVVATAIWLLATAMLVAVSGATLAHHVQHPTTARGHLDHPVMGHFYGAPAMALMTVGVATLVVGADTIGLTAALAVDWVLWTAGTVLGLVTTVLLPLRAMARDADDELAFGGWLMPVVPPMVTSTTGALLAPHLPAGQARDTLLLFCALCFGLSLVISLVVISQIWGRLVRHGVGAAAMVPTYWIVLGPIGQSITAAHHLGKAATADGSVTAPAGDALILSYGVPMLGFALTWMTLAIVLTTRTARSARPGTAGRTGAGLPFTLTWWSFTFPVGTVVTGTEALAAVTGLVALQALAVVLFAGLFLAWAVVLVRSARGVWTGALLVSPLAA